MGQAIDALAARLRAAGCVFAEDEARILLDAAPDADALAALVSRREAGEPLETIVGWVGFAGLRLAVAPGVFVPRQRSVRIARAAARIAAARRGEADTAGVAPSTGLDRPVVVEACCGVAPIAAVVAATAPGSRLLAVDLDPAAVAVARTNLPDDAVVVVGSSLSALPADLLGGVDLIAAVPPYVPESERRLMPHDTFEHEPAAALLGGVDGLDVVRELIADAARWLAPGGRILLELHRSQVAAATASAREHGLVPRRRPVSADGQTALFDAARL